MNFKSDAVAARLSDKPETVCRPYGLQVWGFMRPAQLYRFRANSQQLKTFYGLLPASQWQNLQHIRCSPSRYIFFFSVCITLTTFWKVIHLSAYHRLYRTRKPLTSAAKSSWCATSSSPYFLLTACRPVLDLVAHPAPPLLLLVAGDGALDRIGNNSKRFADFYLKANASIWP